MSGVETYTDLPDTDDDDDDDDGDDGDARCVAIHVTMLDLNNRQFEANVHLVEELADPDELASAIIQCALGMSQMSSSDMLIALQHQLINWGQR